MRQIPLAVTGFGRCGAWTGSEAFGVTPDILNFAKQVTNGASDDLRKALDEELRFKPSVLIADLSAVTFCDSSGFTVFVQTRAKAEEAGVPFILVTQERALLRPRSLLGLDAVLTVHPTLDSARDVLTH